MSQSLHENGVETWKLSLTLGDKVSFDMIGYYEFLYYQDTVYMKISTDMIVDWLNGYTRHINWTTPVHQLRLKERND